MQKTVWILIFENSFSFSCYKLSKFWNGSSDGFSEKGRENMRSSTAESTRVGCDVTCDQYQPCCWRKILYISYMKDSSSSSSEAWWECLAAHYDQDQKEPFLIMKKVLINCKLETRNYKPTAACIDWFNIGPTSTATLNRLEILISKVCCFLL